MPKLNVEKARQAGYSDQEIEQFVRDNDLEIKGSAGNFAGNIFRSGARMVGDLTNAALHPVQTIGNIGTIATGGINKLLPGTSFGEKEFDATKDYFGTRYGISSALKGDFRQAGQDLRRTAYFDPTGTALDAAAVASGVGAGLKGAGAVSKSSKLARAGNFLTKTGEAIDPIYQGSRAIRGATKTGIRGLDDFSREYATAGIGNPAKVNEANRILKQIDYKRIDPVTGKQISSPMTTADMIAEGNLYGRSVDDVVRYSDELGKQFDLIADNPNLPVRIESVTKPLDDLIVATEQSIRDFPNEASFQIQLEELVRNRNNLASKATNGVIPANEVLRMRRELERVTSDAASRGVQLRPGEMQAKQKTVSGLRSGLREADPELTTLGKKRQAIGFDTPGSEGPLLKAFGGYESRAQVRNPITLSGVATGGVGAGIGAIAGGPLGAVGGMIGANLAKNALTSPTGIKMVSKGGQAAARGLGTAGRGTSKLFGGIYPSVRTGAVFNRASDLGRLPPQQPNQRVVQEENSLVNDPYKEIRKQNRFSFVRQ